ncbi:MAG: DUF4136 domain-containing protein [Emcibacter sp.]|nr:DUF4136 domain-containing protein [Emcibacter sp.]
MMNNIFRFVIVLILAGFLSACNNTFTSNVSRFHELPTPQGESVMIVPSDPAKNNSLEFASYANIVGDYLGKLGYRPAGDGVPDLIVELDYGVDDGKVIVRNYSFGYGYGFPHFYPRSYFGYYYPYSYFDFYDPFYGYYSPHRRDVDSYVKYTRKLSMVIRPNQDGLKNLFEGTVESTGRNNNITAIMPHMVQALFTNFPGVSGSTEKIVINLDEK